MKCVEEFVVPLKYNAYHGKIGLSEQDVADMFSNLEQLVQFHKLLLHDLEKKFHCSEVFLQYADYLKAYTQYLNGYEKALTVINYYRNNSKFQAFLSEKRKANAGMVSQH